MAAAKFVGRSPAAKIPVVRVELRGHAGAGASFAFRTETGLIRHEILEKFARRASLTQAIDRVVDGS